MVKKTIFGVIHDQFRPQPPVQHVDLSGKTVVVTGANTGIGFEACKHFATMDPGRLILACRNQTKGEAALEKLRAQTGYKTAQLWLLDLSSYQSVIAFVERFEKEESRLDILVQNAAVAAAGEHKETTDGIDENLQINHLSPALLTFALLPVMVKTARDHQTVPRVVFVTSEFHHWIPEKNLDKLKTVSNMIEFLSNEQGSKAGVRYYPLTKLFNVMFARELNEQLSSSPPTLVANSANPGLCYSELRRDFTGARAFFVSILEKFMAKTAEEGSRQLIYASLGGTDEEMGGEYIACGRPEEVSDFAISDEGKAFQKQLWKETIEALAPVYPPIRQIVDQLSTKSNGGESL